MRKYLYGTSGLCPTVNALLFGELVKLGQNRLELFQADLYHDALYLAQAIAEGERSWFYSVNSTGTCIAPPTDAGLAEVAGRGNVWLVSLEEDKRKCSEGAEWYANIVQIASETNQRPGGLT